MDIDKLKKILESANQPRFRLEQIKKAIYQDGVSSFSEIYSLPKSLREELDEEMKVLSFEVENVLMAEDNQSIKALLKLNDGNMIESVLISPKHGNWSVCISCQVGCPMGCRFCATGKLGLIRNLTAEEITDQVLFWRQYLKNTNKLQPTTYKLDNIVYMGMGEPFMNWENVKESLRVLIDKNLFGFGSRSISVSTSGIPDGIEKLAEDFPQINLAISLHFADDYMRSDFMPVNKKYNLEVLCSMLRNYLQKTNRKVFIEYILLDGVNDDRESADKLVKYLKSIGKLQLLHVNLIRYNTVANQGSSLATLRFDLGGAKNGSKVEPLAVLKSSSKMKTQKFKDYLLKNHIQATIRKSLGDEIQGACGQLAGK